MSTFLDRGIHLSIHMGVVDEDVLVFLGNIYIFGINETKKVVELLSM